MNLTIRSFSPGSRRTVAVTRATSSVDSGLTASPSGPSITWSIAATMRSPLDLVEWTRIPRWSSCACHSERSGSISSAPARGSMSIGAGTGSFATSSDWATTRTPSSIGSTSYRIAAIARCENDTSRTDETRTPSPAGRVPLDLAAQDAVSQVQHPLVRAQVAVADVERLVVDEQADRLAVRHVDDRLTGFGEAVSRLGVRERVQLVEPVQVRARERRTARPRRGSRAARCGRSRARRSIRSPRAGRSATPARAPSRARRRRRGA